MQPAQQRPANPAGDLVIEKPAMRVQELSLWYGASLALDRISLDLPERRITAFIGPSGCGKSTLLRCLNRMNDLVDGVRREGDVRFGDHSIFDPEVDVNALRKRVGMVFQRSNPFPKSIYENVAYGPRIHGLRNRSELDEIVEQGLRRAALWEEVKDRLHESALQLSGGQQQRLCIARALAVEPEVILLDEPCSALDPVATAKIEELLLELRQSYTIAIVTHNMQQAARASDSTAFFNLEESGKPGRLVEVGPTQKIFTSPDNKATEDYVSGRFG